MLPEKMPRSTEHHYPSHAMNREDLVLYVLALIIPLSLLGYGVWRVYVGYVQFGPAAVSAWGQPWFVAATWALIPLFLLTFRAMRLARRSVILSREGITFVGISPKTLPWKQLGGISVRDIRYHLLGLTLRTRRRVTLFPTTGRSVLLDDHFVDLPALAGDIKTMLYPILLADLRAQLQKGQWIYFGPIRFNQSRIEIGKRTLSWDQVQAVAVKSGLLVIDWSSHRPITLQTSQIQNIELLLQLVEELNPKH